MYLDQVDAECNGDTGLDDVEFIYDTDYQDNGQIYDTVQLSKPSNEIRGTSKTSDNDLVVDPKSTSEPYQTKYKKKLKNRTVASVRLQKC